MTEAWRVDAVAHANAVYPREACGLVVAGDQGPIYWPCRNLSTEPHVFVLDPIDYASADQFGEIIGLFHSHPDQPATPSVTDLKACEASGLTWHIVSIPSLEWSVIDPNQG